MKFQKVIGETLWQFHDNVWFVSKGIMIVSRANTQNTYTVFETEPTPFSHIFRITPLILIFQILPPNPNCHSGNLRTRKKSSSHSEPDCWGRYHGPNLQVHDGPRRRQRPPLPKVPLEAASPTTDGPQQLAGVAPKLGHGNADLAGKNWIPELCGEGIHKIWWENQSHGFPHFPIVFFSTKPI